MSSIGGGGGGLIAHEATHISGGTDAFLSTDLLEAIVKRLRESGGATLLLGAVGDGQYFQRSGTGIVGNTPPGAGALATSNRRPASDVTIPDGYSATVQGEISILLTIVITLQGDAVLAIV